MRIILIIFLYATIVGCTQQRQNSYPYTVSAEIINPLNESRKDVVVSISLGDTSHVQSVMVRSNEVQLVNELRDNAVWLYLENMKANEKRKVTIYFGNDPPTAETYTKKWTQAYGDGLESEKVAYLIKDSTINVIDKKTNDFMLMGNYETILKNAISFGTTQNDKVINDGTLHSSLGGVSINAGSRLILCDVEPAIDINGLSVKVLAHQSTNDSYGYVAIYGKQSVYNDNLGLVVLFPANREYYYFGAAWEQEPNGIKNEADFIKWVEKSARELANPVIVNVK